MHDCHMKDLVGEDAGMCCDRLSPKTLPLSEVELLPGELSARRASAEPVEWWNVFWRWSSTTVAVARRAMIAAEGGGTRRGKDDPGLVQNVPYGLLDAGPAGTQDDNVGEVVHLVPGPLVSEQDQLEVGAAQGNVRAGRPMDRLAVLKVDHPGDN